MSARRQPQSPPPSALVERVADTAFIQLEAESFAQLDVQQQALAYWLTQASIAIDPIVYDQLSRFGIREKRLIEEIVARPSVVPPAVFAKIRTFALLFWANRGNHNENTTQKFLPTFTVEELRGPPCRARRRRIQDAVRGSPCARHRGRRAKELEALHRRFSTPTSSRSITAKTPPPGQDILQASSNTFYQGVTLADLASFKEQYPLNSRLVKGPTACCARRSIGPARRTARSRRVSTPCT